MTQGSKNASPTPTSRATDSTNRDAALSIVVRPEELAHPVEEVVTPTTGGGG
jgi:hypothetical protein